MTQSSLDLPAALDGVAYCPGSLNLKSFRALEETDFLDDFRVSALGAVRVLQATANVAPSLTNTPLAARLLSSEERMKASRDRHPLREIGQPDDAASTALFLLSDQSRWITGQVWEVDGGLSSVRA